MILTRVSKHIIINTKSLPDWHGWLCFSISCYLQQHISIHVLTLFCVMTKGYTESFLIFLYLSFNIFPAATFQFSLIMWEKNNIHDDCRLLMFVISCLSLCHVENILITYFGCPWSFCNNNNYWGIKRFCTSLLIVPDSQPYVTTSSIQHAHVLLLISND